MRHQFTVDLAEQPDAPAALLETLASHGIEVRSIGIGGVGTSATAVLITSNDQATHDVLGAEHYKFVEGEAVITSVPDQPGALAYLVRRLSKAGITLQGMSLLCWHQGKAELALSAEDPEILRNTLSSLSLTDGSRASRVA